MNKTLAALCFALTVSASSLAFAADKVLTKSDVQDIIKEYIDENPGVVMDALKKFQEKQRAEAGEKSQRVLKQKGKEIFEDKNSPYAGNAKGDAVVVEFFDYHCGYCKKMLPVVADVLKDDKKLKVIFKELPILSADSEIAARAALAVFRVDPDKYFEFHSNLMTTSGKFDEAMLKEEAKKLGIDEEEMTKEMDSDWVKEELKKNRELADELGVRGTPAFIVGTKLIPGASSAEDLKAVIAEARKAKKK